MFPLLIIILLFFSYLCPLIEKGQNVLIIVSLSGHLLGSVLAHTHAVAVASAHTVKVLRPLSSSLARLINGNVSAWHTAPAGLSLPVIFPVNQGFISQNTSNLAFAADDLLTLASVNLKLFGNSSRSPLCHKYCL